jgi:hypothetical protein
MSEELERAMLFSNVIVSPGPSRLGYGPVMAANRAVAEARLKTLNAEVLRGLMLVSRGRAEELRDESRAMRAEIRQRRLADARARRPFSRPARPVGAPR